MWECSFFLTEIASNASRSRMCDAGFFFFFLINKIPFNVLLKINLRQEAVWRRVCAKLEALEKLWFFLSLCERLWLPCDRTNVTITCATSLYAGHVCIQKLSNVTEKFIKVRAWPLSVVILHH